MSRTVSRDEATLPPLTLTPEEAAAIAVALAAQPDGPYAAAGRSAMGKIVEALEPDPQRRAQLLAAANRIDGAPNRPGSSVPRSAAHPAGRRRPAPEEPTRPRLVVLPGGLS
jgi:predicted DNA-binding transcriptional regulator YafY